MKKKALKQIVRDVKIAAVEYHQLTGKPLGVTGELAELEAAALLGLTLAVARNAGWDATRMHRGRLQRIQIKGRWKHDGKKWGRVSKLDIKKDFDVVMLVLMRGPYEVFEIWEAPREAAIKRLTAPGSKSRNERGSMGVPQFKSIAKQIWPAQRQRPAIGSKVRRRSSMAGPRP